MIKNSRYTINSFKVWMVKVIYYFMFCSLGTGHKVSTNPGWRVAPDFLKKFDNPHKRKGKISSPIQI